MSGQLRVGAQCPNCGAPIHIEEHEAAKRCLYCGRLIEIPRFSQEEKRLTHAVEEMREAVARAARGVEEASLRLAQTGSSEAEKLSRQAEEHHRAMLEALNNRQQACEQAQACRLNGYFRLGEEAQKARRYEEAIGHFQKILAECETEGEVHWRVLMCRYGVEYVLDQMTGVYLPTLTRIQVDNILEDESYKAACLYAQNEAARVYYRQEGERLAEIIEKYQWIAGTEKPYDVFISVKQGDGEGRETGDSRVGVQLYEELEKLGLRVFNSRRSLKPGEEYEPHIMHALSTARLMVVVTSCDEYTNSRWLRNEWRRFCWMKKSEGTASARRLVVYSCGRNALKVPAEIGQVQIIEAEKAADPVKALCEAAGEICGARRETKEQPAKAKETDQPRRSGKEKPEKKARREKAPRVKKEPKPMDAASSEKKSRKSLSVVAVVGWILLALLTGYRSGPFPWAQALCLFAQILAHGFLGEAEKRYPLSQRDKKTGGVWLPANLLLGALTALLGLNWAVLVVLVNTALSILGWRNIGKQEKSLLSRIAVPAVWVMLLMMPVCELIEMICWGGVAFEFVLHIGLTALLVGEQLILLSERAKSEEGFIGNGLRRVLRNVGAAGILLSVLAAFPAYTLPGGFEESYSLAFVCNLFVSVYCCLKGIFFKKPKQM